MNRERVYVFRIGHLGDTLVALPAFQLIADRHRDVPIHLITNRPLAANHVGAANVLSLTGRLGDVFEYDSGSLISSLSLARRLRSGARGIVYNLCPAPGVGRAVRDWAFFRVLCGLRMRGLDLRIALESMIRRRRSGKESIERESDRLVEVVREAGCTGPLPMPPLIRIPPAAISAATRVLGRLPGGRAPIAIGAGSKMLAKRWPVDRYAKVMLDIAGRDPLQTFVLLGDDRERDSMAPIEAALEGRQINLCGELTVVESAAVLEKCILYLGNDTGTMHLAATMGVPCVAVFSARDIPGRWNPFGAGHRIIRMRPACRNCRLEVCVTNGMRCLLDIEVATVTEAVFQALGSVRTGAELDEAYG